MSLKSVERRFAAASESPAERPRLLAGNLVRLPPSGAAFT